MACLNPLRTNSDRIAALPRNDTMGHYRTSGAIGDQLSCIFVDHHLTRWGEVSRCSSWLVRRSREAGSHRPFWTVCRYWSMLLLFKFCDGCSDKLQDIRGDRECLHCLRICPGIPLYISEFLLHVLITASDGGGQLFPSAGKRKCSRCCWVRSQQRFCLCKEAFPSHAIITLLELFLVGFGQMAVDKWREIFLAQSGISLVMAVSFVRAINSSADRDSPSVSLARAFPTKRSA